MRKKPNKSRKSAPESVQPTSATGTKRRMMDLAAELGVSRTTLYAWKKEGAPTDEGSNAVLAWAMDNAKRGQDPAELREAKLEVLRETARRLKLANDSKAGLTVERSEIQLCLARGTAALFAELERFADVEGPGALVGLDGQGCSVVLRGAVERIRDNFRRALAALITNPEGPAEVERASTDNAAEARRLFDLRVATEARWRSCADPAEKTRIWHEELNPLLSGQMPAAAAQPAAIPQ